MLGLASPAEDEGGRTDTDTRASDQQKSSSASAKDGATQTKSQGKHPGLGTLQADADTNRPQNLHRRDGWSV